MGDLEQADLKAFTPPGGHIWRANIKGAWHVHYPPLSRRSWTWNVYGCRHAAVLALRNLWESHLMINDMTFDACPINGLFTRDEVPGQ